LKKFRKSTLSAFTVVAALLICAPAAAQSPDDGPLMRSGLGLARSATLSPALLAQASQADWQREFDTAMQRKSSGKKKMLIGAGVSVGGMLIAALGAGSSCDVEEVLVGGTCDDGLGLVWVGTAAAVGGSGLLLWGGIEYFDANGDLNRLNARRPQSTASFIPLNDRFSVGVSAGARNAVAIRTSW
jgi:hypothetical protein